MILVKTEMGQQVLKDRSVRLTPRQRSAFILFDGRRSVADVLAAGMGVAQEDVEQLVDLGLLEGSAAAVPEVEGASPTAVPEPTAAAAPASAAHGRSTQQRYQDAYPVATRLTAGLGLRGFRLNLAVEAATTYEELAALAPKIRSAVGPEKAAPLEQALGN
ncbi:MAG: hypothetical protein REJ24_22315 [Rhodocyclaceae bacterium]|nr:hypothetical protein [Rhodocyclaceae bacterium]MDQ8001770.1 hypothetical protein [Pseudomonadota bacterium]MDQ8017754.1 hypothetical protein [Pseudomonadota bacterium]